MADRRPVFSDEDAIQAAANFGYGPDGISLTKLPSYDDLNFKIEAGGQAACMKVHNNAMPANTEGRIHAQCRMMARLKENGVPVPDFLPTVEGQPILHWNASTHIWAQSFLSGELLPENELKSRETLQKIGRLCGQVTKALEGYDDPDTHWDWQWHMKNVHLVVREKLQFITDENRKVLAAQLADEYEAVLGNGKADALPHSVIHSDINDTNILFNESQEICGLVDFGDSIYSCTVFELGVAAGYASLKQEDPLSVFSEVLRGYNSAAGGSNRLTEDELKAYWHSAYGRVLLSVCCAAEGIFLEPDDEYMAHTSEPGWQVLEKLRANGVTEEEAVTMFKAVSRGRRAMSVESGSGMDFGGADEGEFDVDNSPTSDS